MVLIVTCLSRDLLRDALVDLAAVISVAAWPLLLCPVFYEQLRLYFENPTYHSSGIDSTHKKVYLWDHLLSYKKHVYRF